MNGGIHSGYFAGPNRRSWHRWVALVLLGAGLLLGSGCAIERLSPKTGQAFEAISRKQATVRLTELDSPKALDAEEADTVLTNLRTESKKSGVSQTQSVGSRIISLSR